MKAQTQLIKLFEGSIYFIILYSYWLKTTLRDLDYTFKANSAVFVISVVDT